MLFSKHSDSMEEKRILLVNVVCGTGSTGRLCTDLVSIYEKHGYTVKIAYGRSRAPVEFSDRSVKIGNNMNILWDVVLSRLFDNAGFNSYSATKDFLRWVDNYNPDILHLHNLHGYYINVELLFNYIRKKKKKIIWTMHDTWAFTGHSALCDGIGCEKWKVGCGQCPQLEEYPKAWKDNSYKNWIKKRAVFSNVENLTIVTPSKWLASCVNESFLNNYIVKTIPNGINTSIFQPKKSELRKKYGIENKFIILGVASIWGSLKGYDDFVKIDKMLEDGYQIVMIGSIKNVNTKRETNIININHIENPNELAEWYSIADVFLNLSYCDTYPTVNIEAVACGTPVITYDVGGCVEAMHGYGMVVEKGNLNAVLENIKKIRAKQWDRRVVDAYLDKESCLQKYCELII